MGVVLSVAASVYRRVPPRATQSRSKRAIVETIETAGSRLRSLRARLSEAFALPALAFALAALTALPSRIAIARADGSERALHLVGGLLSDVATAGPLFVVALVLLGLCRGRRPRVFDGALAAVAIAFLVCLVAENAATEFRFERGVLPGPIDLREGVGHRDFIVAEAPRVFAGRFLVANVLSIGAALLLLFRWRRRAAAGAPSKTPVSGFAVAVLLCVALLFASQRASAYGSRVNNPDVLASPSATFLRGLLQGGHYDGSPAEIRRLFVEGRGSANDVGDGARNLGFDPVAAAQLRAGDCAKHPLARPLDEAPHGPVLDAAHALSHAVFGASNVAPIVFHVSLESMRADDMHVFEPAAPVTAAPFLDEVYRGPAGAAAFGHAHQSGIRTSQALAAVMCGLGALPFNLSASRDLGVLPLRCLPDVLADAHFRTRAWYGHEFVFDDMATFLHAHRVAQHGRSAMPEGAPHGVWNAVSDAAVYDAALAAAEDGGPRYDFVLTLSHHAPYEAPSDMDPVHHAAIDALCRTRGLAGENCDRLRTMRYADDALRGFLAKVEASKDAARTIVVVAADHAVHRWEPWAEEKPGGLSHVPMFVWLPEALRASVADVDAFRDAWDRFRAVAKTTPISNADVPALVLALLADARPLRELPSDARWHTLGGQTTSPSYRSVTGHGVLHGMDAHGQIFDVDGAGGVHDAGIRMESLRGPSEIAEAKPHNRPAIAFLSELLQYGTRCSR